MYLQKRRVLRVSSNTDKEGQLVFVQWHCIHTALRAHLPSFPNLYNYQLQLGLAEDFENVGDPVKSTSVCQQASS